VGRPRPAWLLGLPLAVLGWLTAHTAAYELVAPDHRERARLLAGSGHGYLEYAPLLVATCSTLAALGFLARTRGRAGRLVPAWVLGALPLAGFAVQEHLERALTSGGISWETALQPVFLLGLLLQLPFAFGAALLARALTSVADTFVSRRPGRRRAKARIRLAAPLSASLPAPKALASVRAGRAPPVPA
jgi:hypothetical protein